MHGDVVVDGSFQLRHTGEHAAADALVGDLTQVDLVDSRTSVILCPVKPLDKSANADGQRRALAPVTIEWLASGHHSPLPSPGMAPLLRQLIADYASTGLPPAYVPTDKDIL